MSSADKLQQEVLRLLNGNIRSLSRLITQIEFTPEILASLYPAIKDSGGSSHIIGITGPPGAGKSTLSSALTTLIRASGRTVAILACDPSSPFTGGSVLGDRVRMQSHYTDPGVFIRSVSNRGSAGGLSNSTYGITTLMDAFGFDVILLETVGVGQTELDVMKNSDTVIVVMVPESGDSIQTMKAGLMEIADVFVVNKCDRVGADRMVLDIRSSLQLSEDHTDELTPIIKTRADAGDGISNLLLEIDTLQADRELSQNIKMRRSTKRLNALRSSALLEMETMLDTILSNGNSENKPELASLIKEVELGQKDPITASRALINLIKGTK
ncbi:methylmalonyl Co-A mutase-associated GTPase MeaB [Chloroflexi bacterium]|nr:methylmalonyl Co-A mutase-associated GTPase MeaB [Chloroflexota bacterium]